MELNKVFKRGEIWMVDLNPTKGREQSGVRPALVISDNRFNQSPAELVIVLPITSKKRNLPLHIEIIPPNGGLSMNSYIKCEDIKSISKDRFINKLGTVEEEILLKSQMIIKMLLSFD